MQGLGRVRRRVNNGYALSLLKILSPVLATQFTHPPVMDSESDPDEPSRSQQARDLTERNKARRREHTRTSTTSDAATLFDDAEDENQADESMFAETDIAASTDVSESKKRKRPKLATRVRPPPIAPSTKHDTDAPLKPRDQSSKASQKVLPLTPSFRRSFLVPAHDTSSSRVARRKPALPKTSLAPLKFGIPSTTQPARTKPTTETDVVGTSDDNNSSLQRQVEEPKSKKHRTDFASKSLFDQGKQATEIKRLALALDALQVSVKSADANVAVIAAAASAEREELTARVEYLEGEVADLRDELVSLAASIAAGEAAGTVAVRPPWEVKNNALTKAIYNVLFAMMGTEANEPLPDPMQNNAFYTPSTIADEAPHLRPDWTVSFSNNSKWHSDFIARFRIDGHALSPGCPKSTVDDIPVATLKKLMGKPMFKNLKERYKEQQKDLPERKETVALARRNERRATKAAERAEARSLLADADASDLDWMFQAKWQSSEDSGSDLTTDEGASGEDDGARRRAFKGKKKLKSEVWTSHAPDWRSGEYTKWVETLREQVELVSSCKEAKKAAHKKKRLPRVVGTRKATTMLDFPKSSAYRTPR
ncbi:hypothetical protein PLICRDRAFT_26329 [Plicaturopsis crispa FD-325 SS-3]|nr:hypothetical protein PLICRDRAFT_26329 [Plicaturopsis crispa FD-325 SS-3]